MQLRHCLRRCNQSSLTLAWTGYHPCCLSLTFIAIPRKIIGTSECCLIRRYARVPSKCSCFPSALLIRDLARQTACDLLRKSPPSSGLVKGNANGPGKVPVPCLGETGRPRSPLPDLVLQIPPGPLDLVVCDGCQKVLLRQCTARHAETCKARSKLVLQGGEEESSEDMMDVEAVQGTKKKARTTARRGFPQLRASPPGLLERYSSWCGARMWRKKER